MEVSMTLPLLSPIRVPLDESVDAARFVSPDNSAGAEVMVRSVEQTQLIKADYTTGAEVMVRAALENCASRLIVPSLPRAFRGAFKFKLLSPTSRAHLSIVDRRDTVWHAVRSYLLPINEELRVASGRWIDEEIGDDLYHLALATRLRAQVHIDLEFFESLVSSLLHTGGLLPRSEAAARLSLIRGSIAHFRRHESLPGLEILGGADVAFRDRMEDILSDAYLRDASRMRRFLSYESNKASVRRDLRQLLRAIVKFKKWAIGVVKVAEHSVILPPSSSDILGTLISEMGLSGSSPGPVVLNVRQHAQWRRWFDGGKGWWSPVKPLWASAAWRRLNTW